MEFRFRAGEDCPPSYLPPSIADAYLPPQSLRGISSRHDFTFTMPSSFGPTSSSSSSSSSLPQFPPGYFGPKLQRHDPLQNPMMIPVNPMMNHGNPMMMMPVREAVRRELEKELIREEIIAGEILRKRQLEEEVRRELAYEREVALRRQAHQFSLQGRKHNKKAKEEEFLNKPPCGSNKTEAAELMNQNKVKEKWFCDLCNVRATSEFDLKNGHLQGKKHKAKVEERELLIASETGGGNNIEAEELVIPKAVKMEWSCDLCQVMAPNEQALIEHLYGKKHKAKEEELLIASKCDEGNKTEAAELMNQNKVKEEWFCDLCNVHATSELDLKNGHLQGKKHKAKVEERELLTASETGGGNNIEAEELVIPKVVKMEWSCDLCQVMAPNEQALIEHLCGKKHKAKEEELLIASKCDEGNKTEAAELMNQNKVKEEWFCDLCNVHATSELDLKNGHLQGKKHKAKAEERELLTASETGGGNDIEAEELVIPKVVKMEWSCDLCHVMAPNEQALIEHLCGKKHKAKEEELLIASKCDEGNKTEAAELMNQNKVKEEWFCDLCNVRATSELDLKNGHLQGKKHKAKVEERELLIASETGGGDNIEAEELVIPKVVKMEWSCDLCQVMAPNEQALIEHLCGKKHKAKEEELLIASKCDEGNKTEAAELINPNKVKKEWSCALCQVSPPNEQHLNKHLQGKKHKAKEKALLIASKPASSFTTSKKADNSNTPEKQGVTSNEQQKKLQQQVPKEANEIVSKKSLLPYCEHCNLQCNSESMLASHLRGKKHLSRMLRVKAMLAKVNEESRADLVAKAMEENIKPSGNNNKGPALNKDDKSNKLVNKVMTTSSSKLPQKLQVGQCMQQVPKKQSKAVKNLPVHCVLCNVECYGEHMLGSHLRGKKHLARMKELESHKELSVNHAEDANARVTYGKNEESQADVNKVVDIIEVKQSIGSHQDEQEVGSERTSIGNHQDEQEVGSERTSIGNHQDEQEVGSERTRIGNHQDEQEVESERKSIGNHQEVESERTSIGNHQDEQEVESERTSSGNHQDEQVVASETMDGVPVPSTEEVANRMEGGARKNFSLGNLTHAIVRFLFIFSVAGY